MLLAAGKGVRFKSLIPKPLVNLNSLPLIVYSLDKFSQSPPVKDIIVVANPRNAKSIKEIIRRRRIKKVRAIVFGGRRRQDSVAKGLARISASADLVLIHDAARPFFNKKIIPKLAKEAFRYGAAILGVPVKATIKEAQSAKRKAQSAKIFTVKKTLERSRLWEIQTPQVFKKSLILKAYKKFGDSQVTDDASLLEKLGVQVNIVRGSYDNIKITTPEDLVIAEAILKSQKSKFKSSI